MAKTMRAVDIHGGAGGIDKLYINSSTPIPNPSSCSALVKIKAFGLNRMDLLQREGHYPLPPQAPSTLGVEFSGTIETLGAEATGDFKIGDQVFGLAYGGAYAEYIAVSTRMLVHKPKELSWEEAAGIPETWITATQALYLVGEFAAGKSVLWHAGASSVSIAGVQLARAEGAKAVYVTAGSDEKVEFCEKELGATKGFNYKTGDWSKKVLEETGGKGVDLIVDFVGGTYFQQNINAAGRDGRIVLLGMMGGMKASEVDIGGLLFKRVRVEGSTLRSRDEVYQGKLRDQLVVHALPKFIDGTFKVIVDKVFKMEEVQEAHKLLESNTTKGKVICTVD
ncbi:MAG: hypothetical protein Q9227_008477 [Pyrenula ochraceoflavens]